MSHKTRNIRQPTRTPSKSANQAQARLQQAVALHRHGQLAQAETLYTEVLAALPRQPDALHLSGVIALQKNNPERAVELIQKAIEVSPRNADFHFNCGNAFLQLNQPDAAVHSYDKAIAIRPNGAEVHYNKAVALKNLNRLEAALQSYDQAIRIKSDYADAYRGRGSVLQKLKQLHAALQSYDKAIAIRPEFAEAHSSRGNALQELDRLDAAMESYDQALVIKPHFAEAHYNRALALKKLKRLEAAIASHDKAIAIKPDYVEAHAERGNALLDLKQPDAALRSYDAALAYAPEHAGVLAQKALVLLLKGDFDTGWKLYEWRWKCDGFPSRSRDFPQPLWLGNDVLQGKTILLHCEQGLGDTIQFCRYAEPVSRLGAQVVLEAPKSLAGLLASLEGVSRVIEAGAPLPPFDFHCPLLSLPLAFKTDIRSIPGAPGYLTADASKIAAWRARLGPQSKPLVGLAWSGSAAHKNDGNRSLRLSDLVRHLPDDFQYVSLQKDVREVDAATLRSHPHLLHFEDAINDFTDTAALCELMDVVNTVDTSVAHLSGALGKNTWLLLPHVPDWRWLLERNDSPWYPAMTLYRQQSIGDWPAVFTRVSADLNRLF
jgi:tetratricopeptide (TPR) repeat protein